MKILEPGHLYQAQCYDGEYLQLIQFMKRLGHGYPGNRGVPHPGTNCQELLRILINRVKYLDNQIHDVANTEILASLRSALYWFEERARVRRGQRSLEYIFYIEDEPVCEICGHILCKDHKNG